MKKDLIRKSRSGCGAAAISLLGLLCVAGPISAQTVVIDSDAGTIGGLGKGGTFDGATIGRVTMDTTGVTTFYLLGNLTVPNNQVVMGTGSRPIQLIVGNDLVIQAGATIDASGLGATPGPGGGAPGGAGSGGAGGAAGASAAGGTGGAGSSAPGTAGTPGATGMDGLAGLAGILGGDGYGNTGSGGAAGNGGTVGTGGAGGAGGTAGPGGGGKASHGGTGGLGSAGSAGSAGTAGGGGLNDVTGFILSGGGAGGSGGGAGGSGAGGDGGAGGGGGAGAGATASGGNGGNGGTGGAGGNGGTGGAAGAGGGVIVIRAMGRATVAGMLLAQGGAGATGTVGTAGAAGSKGVGGTTVTTGGGNGGPGNTGGTGATGARGGTGGGGAGGTIELAGSVVIGTNSVVDTTGGTHGGGNGRFLLGQNNSTPFAGTINNATETTSHGWLNADPILFDVPNAANIPELVGGADSYGLTTLSASSSFSAVVAAADGSPAALVLAPQGPAPYNNAFSDYSYLFFVNTTRQALTSPMLGVGSSATFLSPLYEGGEHHNPIFFTGSRVMLPQLNGNQVYVITIPNTNPGFFNFSATIGGTTHTLTGQTTTQFTTVGGMQVLYLP